jgi:3-deoxy-D-manno-octulosonic acid kinase
MLATFTDISRSFLNQKKDPLRMPSGTTRTVFWRTPFLDEEQTISLLKQWRRKASDIEHLFGDQKRYVFPQLELTLGDRIFIPKIYKVRKLSQNLIALAFSEAERNCATQTYLFDKAVRVPMPAGVLNTYNGAWLAESIFFQEKLPASGIAYKHFLLTGRDFAPDVRFKFYTQLGRELGKLHVLGVYTEDTDQNMLVEMLPGDEFRFHFFDFDNFYPWRYPNLRRTSHAFRHYADSDHYTCTPEELNIFLDSYLEIRDKRQWRAPIMENLKTLKPHIFTARKA